MTRVNILKYAITVSVKGWRIFTDFGQTDRTILKLSVLSLQEF